MLVSITHGEHTFKCSARQAAALDALLETNAGGFATVKGYVSTSGRVTPEVADITFISRFSVEKMYQRKIAALQALTLAECLSELRDHPKIKATTTEALFEAFDVRKASEIASMEKTLAGVRDDAHRQAHDRNYCTLGQGVKVHYLTEKNSEGIMVPVLDGGVPVVDNIMLNILQVSKSVIVPGEYKSVNSGVPVLLSNAMKRKVPKTCNMKALSLKEGKFESLHIAGIEMIPEEFRGF